ncbi:TlpA family protein disulfide reductase [Planomonospora sp. ID67723]|uniref:TlpA disulfide reductase family protein n=1 Tax=Planomonospora sp. ID67723 TaxID=2738134 RepID=UPI0018C3EDAF|nr:TlpA disulfide reductase family protein [Planomonospora sp. ID67723]MBG0832314.1 TlpA family protein disulfide reductase [Planomonospora sp. ID67723]
MITLLADGRESAIEGRIVPHGTTVLGWERKPHGWCRGEACVPSFRAAAAETDGGVDLVAFAELLGRQAVADEEEGVIAVGEPAWTVPGEAPGFEELTALRGTKAAVVFWASWCGCRYDLPAWEALHREMAGYGFSVLSVSLDRDPADAREWLDGVTHPAVVDADGRIAELYNVVNVPTVIWVDEAGRIARPQDTMTATDTFRSMNGLSSERAVAALRRWVTEGEAGTTDRELRPPTEDERRARLHARVAAWLLRAGRTAAAVRHLETAAGLAPHDLAIRRGLMPLRGIDPFGEEYFKIREELEAAGIAIYRPLPDWQEEPR